MNYLNMLFEISFRLYAFSGLILSLLFFFSALIAIYSWHFFQDKKQLLKFYFYLLITLGLASGAVLANNLFIMLFFWEGLLLTLYAMIQMGSKNAYKTAAKAFIINAVADLCLMLGIILVGFLANTMIMTKIVVPLNNLGTAAFILLFIGASAKAGAMPFHSWIPDAGLDAPLPFMALIPAAFDKLLGIYFLTRICLDLFKLDPSSWLSTLLMSIGAITIILAVMMALVQKNMKGLLSFHAISQVGYMILGIGTCLPIGIIGGIFHMINNAFYKSCLFLCAGSVEKQTGTTQLEELGGLSKLMPITFICFIITALSISGVPPFNGFFSKEMLYDAALERGWYFYAAAILGSFFTGASFLKLGHAVFLGKTNKIGKEAHWSMLLPMLILSGACVFLGFFNYLPIQFLSKAIIPAHNALNFILVGATLLVILLALLNHFFGVKKYGQAIKALDHIHYFPLLAPLYDHAEKKHFDPFELGSKFALGLARLSWLVDRLVDAFYNLVAAMAMLIGKMIKSAHTGNYSFYLAWVIAASFILMWYVVR